MGEDKLIEILKTHSISDTLITDVIESGYFINKWYDPWAKTFTESISDKLYGNKSLSSSFEVEKFIRYIKGEAVDFEKIVLNEYEVKSFEEIKEVLNEEPRRRYIESGKLSFRGQSKEHHITRKIPNPVRKNDNKRELSIMPGIYRNKPLGKSAFRNFNFENPLQWFLHELEPGIQPEFQNPHATHDILRVEQHYASQTEGLDITFDIRSALYFATHRYQYLEEGKATYHKVETGQHTGVIYCLVFLDPPVKKTEFYVRGFDFFTTYTPERVLRQHCGLPIFHQYERNIAATDVNCIIRLHPDFDYEGEFSYQYMFPSAPEDRFYGKLLELKTKFSEDLKSVMEYV